MKILKKISLLLLCIALMIPSLALITSAKPKDEEEPTDYLEWTLSEDKRYLDDGTRKFARYEKLPPDFFISAQNIYVFHNDDGYGGTIYSTSRDAEIVWIENQGVVMMYATIEGRDILDDFIDDPMYYSLASMNGLFADIRNSTVDSILKNQAKYEADVRTLQYATRYEIIANTENSEFSYTAGTVFLIEADYYYADHRSLDNSFFDSDGQLSFRSGKIPLSKLNKDQEALLDESIKALEARQITYIYEEDDILPDVDPVFEEGVALVVFWIIFVLLGFIAPTPLLILGITLPHSKKRGYPKYWRILTWLAIAWMALALILAILLIL